MLRGIFAVLLVVVGFALMATDDASADGCQLANVVKRGGTDGGIWLNRGAGAPFLPATEVTCPSDNTVQKVIQNNSGSTIWCGGPDVSARTGHERGVLIPTGGAWAPCIPGRGGVFCATAGGATDAGISGIPITCGVK